MSSDRAVCTNTHRFESNVDCIPCMFPEKSAAERDRLYQPHCGMFGGKTGTDELKKSPVAKGC